MAANKQSVDPNTALALSVAGELRELTGKLKRRLREESRIGTFTWPQVQVLVRLEREGPATVTTLARAEGVRPQSMGETLSILKAAGLVSGAPDPADGRQTVLSITERCRELIRVNRAAREDWLFRAIQTQLAPDELTQLANAVELLKRIANA
jgi:DNA-binding MarR family transcriptional regulator